MLPVLLGLCAGMLVLALAGVSVSRTLTAGVETARDEGSAVPDIVGQPRYAGAVVLVLASDRVIAFDAITASFQWSFDQCPGASWLGPYATPTTEVMPVRCGTNVIGLDVASGQERWHRTLDFPANRTRFMSHTLLFNNDDEGRFHAVDTLTGELLIGKRDMGGSNGAANSRLVIMSTNTGVTAFDRNTGAQQWFAGEPSSGLFAVDGSVFARTNDHRVTRLDDHNGQVVWSSEPEGSRLDYSDIAGVTNSTVVAHTAHRGLHRVTVYDRDTGQKRWEYDAPSRQTAYPALGSDIIVLSDTSTGTVSVRDDRTGEEIRRFQTVAGERAAAAGSRVAYIELDRSRRVLQSVDVRN